MHWNKKKVTWPAEILSNARLTRESIASETLIWFLISSPTVNGRFNFPWPEPEAEPEPEPGLFLEPEPGDFKPKAFLTLLAAVEVNDLWIPSGELWLGESEWLLLLLEEELAIDELRGLPEEVRHAATKIS